MRDIPSMIFFTYTFNFNRNGAVKFNLFSIFIIENFIYSSILHFILVLGFFSGLNIWSDLLFILHLSTICIYIIKKSFLFLYFIFRYLPMSIEFRS